MTSTRQPEETTHRGLLRLALAAAVALAALTAGSTGVAASTDFQAPAQPTSLTPGFLLERGRFTTIEAPRATLETGAGGINNRGEIVGTARGGGMPDRGFLRDTRGRFTTIRYPGARSTNVQKINDRGQVTGYYSRTTDDPRENPTGFLLDRGRFTKLAFPGAVTTTATGINNRTQVVGQYFDADCNVHGYVWERGRFRTVDAPGAVGTSLIDINDRGQILGGRVEPDGTISAFVLDRGRYTFFTDPDAAVTLPYDINNRGQIVGLSLTGTGDELQGGRGFLLARGARGPFTPISFPGAPQSGAFGLNDRGQITGVYENPNAASTPREDGGSLPMVNPCLPDEGGPA